VGKQSTLSDFNCEEYNLHSFQIDHCPLNKCGADSNDRRGCNDDAHWAVMETTEPHRVAVAAAETQGKLQHMNHYQRLSILEATFETLHEISTGDQNPLLHCTVGRQVGVNDFSRKRVPRKSASCTDLPNIKVINGLNVLDGFILRSRKLEESAFRSLSNECIPSLDAVVNQAAGVKDERSGWATCLRNSENMPSWRSDVSRMTSWRNVSGMILLTTSSRTSNPARINSLPGSASIQLANHYYKSPTYFDLPLSSPPPHDSPRSPPRDSPRSSLHDSPPYDSPRSTPHDVIHVNDGNSRKASKNSFDHLKTHAALASDVKTHAPLASDLLSTELLSNDGSATTSALAGLNGRAEHRYNLQQDLRRQKRRRFV